MKSSHAFAVERPADDMQKPEKWYCAGCGARAIKDKRGWMVCRKCDGLYALSTDKNDRSTP